MRIFEVRQGDTTRNRAGVLLQMVYLFYDDGTYTYGELPSAEIIEPSRNHLGSATKRWRWNPEKSRVEWLDGDHAYRGWQEMDQATQEAYFAYTAQLTVE